VKKLYFCTHCDVEITSEQDLRATPHDGCPGIHGVLFWSGHGQCDNDGLYDHDEEGSCGHFNRYIAGDR